MCNCRNKRTVAGRLNAHLDRGSRNPDIRIKPIVEAPVMELTEQNLADLQKQACPEPTALPTT